MSLAASYVDSDTLTLVTDRTADFVVNRKVRADCGASGYMYTVVSSATFNDPYTTVNMTAGSDDLGGTLVAVDWSVVKTGTAGNIPLLHHRDEDTGGLDFGWPTKPCNSKGNSFATVQGAIDDLAGDGWVFVPTGTWSEALVIDENYVLLYGAGRPSIIDGATTGHAINVSGDNCVVRDLQCMTTAGSGNAYSAIYNTGAQTQAIRAYVSQSDDFGIAWGAGATNGTISECYVTGADTIGAYLNGPCRAIGNHIYSIGTYGIYVGATGDNCIMTHNFIDTTGDDGIAIVADAENCVVDGNRITNWTGEAIDDDSGTSTIGDNDLT